ncbi:MAG: helix-turn-helix domain-containing protein, partial [Bryobacteraceae bacterium]
MQTLGQRLRAERVDKGRSIQELAGLTRIRSEYFEAIENDRADRFPGPFFYRSFLRQYAALLELPESVIEHEIQRSLDDERAVAAERSIQAAENKPDVPPLPTGRTDLKAESKRWLMRLASLVAVLVACSGAYFAWLRWGQRFFLEEHAPLSAAKPTRQAAAQHPQPATASPPAAQAPATPVEKQLAPEQSAQSAAPATSLEKQGGVPPAPAPSVDASQGQGLREDD